MQDLTNAPNSFQNGDVTALTFAPDGETFAIGTQITSTDSRLQQWRFGDQTKLLETTFTNSRIQAINYLTDGREVLTLVTNVTKGVRLCRFNGPFVEHVFPEPHQVLSTSLSPDGKLLAIVGGDRFLRFWRVADGRQLLTFAQEPGGVTAVAFAPDGKTFAYGRGDGIVAIARMPTLVTKAEIRTNQFNFEWQGGSGLYQVQQATSVNAAVWANLGSATTATNLAVPMTNPAVFFRVQSVTNAP